MSIYRLNIDSGILQQSGQVQGQPAGTARDPSQDATAESAASDQVLLSGTLGAAYKELQLKTEQQNATAGAIRRTDKAAEALGQKIDAVKAPLELILKNFPPFFAGDEERVKLLKTYSSIRQEIDKLTIPPPPDAVQARKAITLPPSLPTTADDSQIADHLSKLDAAAADIEELRDGLAADTAKLPRYETPPAPAEGPSVPVLADEATKAAQSPASMSESAALGLSVEVGRQFATSLRQGMTAEEHPQFLKGLS